MYNLLGEETIVGLFKKLEKFYITEFLTNKLYSMHMSEGCGLLEHFEWL